MKHRLQTWLQRLLDPLLALCARADAEAQLTQEITREHGALQLGYARTAAWHRRETIARLLRDGHSLHMIHHAIDQHGVVGAARALEYHRRMMQP